MLVVMVIPSYTSNALQVGVPRSIAFTLTVPERVTQYNFDALKLAVRNGPDVHPGAVNIIQPDGTRKKITSNSMQVGWH